MKGRQAASHWPLDLARLCTGKKAFIQAGERLGLPARELAMIRGALDQVPHEEGTPRGPG